VLYWIVRQILYTYKQPMTNFWYNPWLRGLTIQGTAVIASSLVTFGTHTAVNRQIISCTATKTLVVKVENKKLTETCNKLFKDLDNDLDPWVYFLIGLSLYVQIFGWASGAVSIHTAMESKPLPITPLINEDFEIERPTNISNELYLFGFHLAKVLKNDSLIVKNPTKVFTNEFLNFKYRGVVKRDLFVSAFFTSYPYLNEETQDKLRSFLKDLTMNSNDQFYVSEIGFYFAIISKRLGSEPSKFLMKEIALAKALVCQNIPDLDTVGLGTLPTTMVNQNFTSPEWLSLFSDWTNYAKVVKNEADVILIYDPSNPAQINSLAEAQLLLNNLFL
jgi:hypothetical protein